MKVKQFEEDIGRCRLLIMDGNLEISTMEYILDVCRSARVPGRAIFQLRLIIKDEQIIHETWKNVQQIHLWYMNLAAV